MINLDSIRWSELKHAYGDAANIPSMLKELSSFPSYENYQSEPYFSLWSALCHQGDVFTASYAALPHIIALLENYPEKAHFELFLLPASIEIFSRSVLAALAASQGQVELAESVLELTEDVLEEFKEWQENR